MTRVVIAESLEPSPPAGRDACCACSGAGVPETDTVGLNERNWRRTFGIIWFSATSTTLAFTSAVPLLSLYVQELGITDRAAAAAWAGLMNGTSLALAAVFSVVWGALANRWGLKIGLVRALFLASAGLLVTGLAQTPEQMLLGRLLHGLSGGPNGAVLLLVGPVLPGTHMSLGMGLLQMGQSIGQGLGPLLAGVIGDALGFRYALYGAAALVGVAALIVYLFVPEPQRRVEWSSRQNWRDGVRYLTGNPRLQHLILLQIIVQTGYQSFWMFVPLQVQNLVADPAQVGRWAGATLLGDALGLVAGAALLGWAAPTLGAQRVLVVASIVACAATALQPLVERVELLIGLRFVLGMCVGGMLPVTRALLSAWTSRQQWGFTFGISHGAFTAAFAVGALVGSVAAAAAGLVGAFGISAALFALAARWSARHTFATGVAQAHERSVVAGIQSQADPFLQRPSL